MYDVAIVGGGPAGASAATFTARAGLQTVLIDADAGMTRRAMLNNHLGFPEGAVHEPRVRRDADRSIRLKVCAQTGSHRMMAARVTKAR